MFNPGELVSFQTETFDEVIEDIKPLIEEHWKEIALYQDHIELEPDYEEYKLLSDSGLMKIFTARESGELIGYLIVTISPHMHYSSHLFATNDIIYLRKDLRSIGIGKRLISFAEKILRQQGVSVFVMNMKTHQPFDPLMKSLGYDCIERLYGKYIGEE